MKGNRNKVLSALEFKHLFGLLPYRGAEKFIN